MILRALAVWRLLSVLFALLLGPLAHGRLPGSPPAEPLAALGVGLPRGETADQGVAIEFVRGRHGGLCVNDGDGALCRTEITVRDDGTWSAAGFPPPAPAEGTTRKGAATRLAAIVESAWDSLTARPFTGTCPVAYDGQEMYYIVRRLPIGKGAELADADVRELRSCTHDLEYAPARRALNRLEAEWAALDLELP